MGFKQMIQNLKTSRIYYGCQGIEDVAPIDVTMPGRFTVVVTYPGDLYQRLEKRLTFGPKPSLTQKSSGPWIRRFYKNVTFIAYTFKPSRYVAREDAHYAAQLFWATMVGQLKNGKSLTA